MVRFAGRQRGLMERPARGPKCAPTARPAMTLQPTLSQATTVLRLATGHDMSSCHHRDVPSNDEHLASMDFLQRRGRHPDLDVARPEALDSRADGKRLGAAAALC